MGGQEVNYVHAEELLTEGIRKETETAAVWKDNWGYLAEREPPPPRGFSTAVAKYAFAKGQWTVASVRVPDGSEAGIAAARIEQHARKSISRLTWESAQSPPTKKCVRRGKTLVRDNDSGVETRAAAEGLRSFHLHVLGGSTHTEGVDPSHKYKAPVCDSHEYGWRVPSSSNPGGTRLELFGVADHGRKSHVKHFD